MNEPKVQLICAKCGSANIAADAAARWSILDQEWQLTAVYGNKTCEDCGYDHNCEERELNEDERREVEAAQNRLRREVGKVVNRGEIEVLPEEEEERRGRVLAQVLKLRRKPNNGRFDMEGGEMTTLGLYRMVQRIVEGDMGRAFDLDAEGRNSMIKTT